MALESATFAAASAARSVVSYPPYPSVPSSPFPTEANLTSYAQPANPQDFAVDGPPLELVHELYGDFPTGVAVDIENRLFFNLPRSSSNTTNTLVVASNFTAEVPYPNSTIQQCHPGQNVSTCFVNIQSVVIDSAQRLWALDTGMTPGASVATPYAAKIMAFNLTTNEILANYVIPPSLTAGGASINDVRFNLSLSTAGVAFLSDEKGSLFTIDLGSGDVKQRISNTSVTNPDEKFVGSYDGTPFYQWRGTTRSYVSLGADGIALQSGNVYFSPLASRRFYYVPQSILANSSASDEDILNQVQFLGQLGSYTEGFTADDQGRVYMGTAEQNSVSYFDTLASQLNPNETLNGLNLTGPATAPVPPDDYAVRPFVRSALVQWPDSMAIQNDYLWFTTNQLPLSPSYQRANVDLRQKPFKTYRAFVGAGPAV